MYSLAMMAGQVPPLSGHGVAMLVLAVIFFAFLVWDRLPIATICLALLAALPLVLALFPLETAAGKVDPLRFFAGFGSAALVAICSLMIMGHALVLTGALEPAARGLAGWVARAPRLALLAVLLGAAAASGVLNDTPVVVLLIPLIIGAAARARAQAGTMLMSMNYAVLIGGMATTLGTSTNLIVVGIAASLGVATFSVFSFYSLVAIAAIPAMIYLWLVAPRMLAHVTRPAGALTAKLFEAELHVEPGSWMDGRELRHVLAAAGHKLNLREVRRGARRLVRLPSMVLRAGDRLLLQDTAENLKEAESSLKARLHDRDEGVRSSPASQDVAEASPKASGDEAGAAGKEARAKPADDKEGDEPGAPVTAIVAQMIITPTSPLVGRSVRSERIGERYGVVIVGVRPGQGSQAWQRVNPVDRQLAAGDVLLMQGEESAMREAQNDDIGLLLDARFTLPRQDKATLVLVTMAVVVVLAATKTLPIALAALGGVLVMLLSRCLSWRDVGQSLSVKVILLVASSLALGDALQVTGATAHLAGQLAVHAQGLSPAWMLALVMALMGLLTNFVSNNAAAAIGTPLGIELARSLGVPPEPFVLSVLFGCNLCYLTPMGYQTNLLVMNAGGYRFSDFVRVGTPLFIIMWAGLSYGLALRYGL